MPNVASSNLVARFSSQSLETQVMRFQPMRRGVGLPRERVYRSRVHPDHGVFTNSGPSSSPQSPECIFRVPMPAGSGEVMEARSSKDRCKEGLEVSCRDGS